MKKIAQETINEILEMVRNRPDLTYFEIAQKFKCSDDFVHHVARQAGISRTGRNKGRTSTTPEMVERIRVAIEAHPDLSYEKIASLTGIQEYRVSITARKLNGMRRTVSACLDAKIERELQRAFYEGGYSRTWFTREIAEKVGCSQNHVIYIQGKGTLKRNHNYWSYEEAQRWVQNAGITSWEMYSESKLPLRIPANPDLIYADKWVSWSRFLGTPAKWTRPMILAFFKDIEALLPSLSDADLFKLLRGAKILPALKMLSTKGGLADILQAVRDGHLPDHPSEDPLFDDEGVQESDYETPEIKIDYHAADRAKSLNASAATIHHIIESQLSALRAKWFREGEATSILIEFSEQVGGEFFQEISQRFLEDVTAVESLATPWWGLHKNGKPVSPSPMQKYVAWRLKKDRVFGNWSGTGAGKTNSAGLAAYVIGSKLTVVLAANSTILGWKAQLEETFPGCQVYTKMSDVQRGPAAFLILNYEQFQTMGARARAEKIVALCPDFVVLDEIQSIKQRGGEASFRSVVVREMLVELPQAHVLGMSATPVINELREGISLLETIRQETSALKTKGTIPIALDLFAALRQIGVRYSPKYEQTEETVKMSIQRDDLRTSLQNMTALDILPIEQTLLPAKLELVKDRIKPGTILYLEYVEGMVNTARAFVESLGFSVGEYVGDTDTLQREEVKKQFIAGEIDVLIGSRAISLGVDGLQQRCSQLILLSLPWTHAAYTQVVGRVYRQGGTGTVQVVLPQVVVGNNGTRWSWDEMRLKHIEAKRTLAECATDGIIPTASNLSRTVLATKAIEALQKLSKKAAAV